MKKVSLYQISVLSVLLSSFTMHGDDLSNDGMPSNRYESTCTEDMRNHFTQNITTKEQLDTRIEKLEQRIKDARAAVNSASKNRAKANKAGNNVKVNDWKSEGTRRKRLLGKLQNRLACLKAWAPSFKPAR